MRGKNTKGERFWRYWACSTAETGNVQMLSQKLKGILSARLLSGEPKKT